MKKKRPPLPWPKISWALRKGGVTELILTGSTSALGCKLTCQHVTTKAEIDHAILPPWQIRRLAMTHIRTLFSNYINRKVA